MNHCHGSHRCFLFSQSANCDSFSITLSIKRRALRMYVACASQHLCRFTFRIEPVPLKMLRKFIIVCTEGRNLIQISRARTQLIESFRFLKPLKLIIISPLRIRVIRAKVTPVLTAPFYHTSLLQSYF